MSKNTVSIKSKTTRSKSSTVSNKKATNKLSSSKKSQSTKDTHISKKASSKQNIKAKQTTGKQTKTRNVSSSVFYDASLGTNYIIDPYNVKKYKESSNKKSKTNKSLESYLTDTSSLERKSKSLKTKDNKTESSSKQTKSTNNEISHSEYSSSSNYLVDRHSTYKRGSKYKSYVGTYATPASILNRSIRKQNIEDSFKEELPETLIEDEVINDVPSNDENDTLEYETKDNEIVEEISEFEQEEIVEKVTLEELEKQENQEYEDDYYASFIPNKPNHSYLKYVVVLLMIVVIILGFTFKNAVINIFNKKEQSINLSEVYYDETKISDNDFLIKNINEKINLKQEIDNVNFEGFRIVEVAKKELGNDGKKYWTWYGLNRHSEWCYEFVSWCADQCGYIETGQFKKFAAVKAGAAWYIDNGHWLKKGNVPKPGMIIFFDFANKKLEPILDGLGDHVGIVEKVVDGVVYTIEGNSNDRCMERKYPVNSPYILGYGVPFYYYE